MNKMANQPSAHFISYPHSINDLQKPFIAQLEKPFVIEKIITLKKYDYENFITDLCADRGFIEENNILCRVDNEGIWHCLYIKQIGKNEGILVMSDGAVFPKYAAYIAMRY
jgi:hypothetical protein